MSSMEFIIEGNVAVKVTVTEVDGNLSFNVHVIQEGEEGYTGQIGELNGFFFDLAGNVDDSTFNATANDGTALAFDVDEGSVANLGGGINLNGEVVKEYGKYDVGVVLDETGLGNGDVQDITFTLDGDTDLSLADVALQDFGLRLTSVGEPDGPRNGSLKLGGEAPEEPVDPPEEAINTANDDTMTVEEFATFGDGFDFLDTGGTLLTNDTTETEGATSAYGGQVIGSQGATVDDEAITVAGTNGGLLMIFPDGTVDFSANGEFDALTDLETAETTFDYTIEGGDMATLTVTIIGSDFEGGGGGFEGGFGGDEFLF